MKRFLHVALLSLVAVTLAKAQNCNPDVTITQPGVYPEQPDTAYINQAYDFVFQVLAIKDTTTMFNGQLVNADIDSVNIDNVLGLPAGFSYTCEPANCSFTHKAVGCIKLSGNPTSAQSGVYSIKIATTAFASLGFFKLPVKDTADNYSLVIMGSSAVLEKNKEIINIYPNPAVSGKFLVATSSPASSIELTDLQGKNVDSNIVENNNAYSFDISALPKGVYLINLEIDYKRYTHKIIH